MTQLYVESTGEWLRPGQMLTRINSLVADRDALREALERIEALRTNEHAAGFDEAREIAAAALECPE